MVQYYTIAGRQFGSHVLAMLTLGTLGGGITLAMGGKKATKAEGPPINASSSDEESFIKDFLKNAEADEKKGAKIEAKH